MPSKKEKLGDPYFNGHLTLPSFVGRNDKIVNLMVYEDVSEGLDSLDGLFNIGCCLLSGENNGSFRKVGK